MEGIYEELDEAKAEIEKLREDYRAKAELAESLKRAHVEQLSKNQQASAKLEKLIVELSEKEDEICATKQMFEEQKCILREKEAALKRLTSAYDKFKVDSSEKLRDLEEQNKGLALALDEANTKNMDQERQIQLLKEEIEGTKRLLTVSQKKYSEADSKVKASREQQQRDDVIFMLEEEKRTLEDQLKWKKEQFCHLEEAHQKLRYQFREREKEWEKEKHELIDEISSVQTKLESQVRISEDLQSRLQMCNQALANEESRRKLLEVQLSESRSSFDSICTEYEDFKLKFESLMSKRDTEIAAVKAALNTRETLYKEMEYQVRKLEQEKQDLMASLKELQEAHIQEAGRVSSVSKLRNKLKGLEQVHRECSMNLKTKEAEWSLQMEKLMGDLNVLKSSLEGKNKSINELKQELEACHSLMVQLEQQKEETSLMFLVLKSEISEAQLKVADNFVHMGLKTKEREEKISLLAELVEVKNAALVKVEKDLEQQYAKTVFLTEKVKSLEEEQLSRDKELQRLQEVVMESSTEHAHLEEQAVQMRSELEEAYDALKRANAELDEKFCEANELGFELQIWKSIAEQLKLNLEENHQMRKDVEASLLAQIEVEVILKEEREGLLYLVEEKNKQICDLQQQLEERLKVESPTRKQKIKEENTTLDLQREIDRWEEEWVKRELEGAILAQIDAEKNHAHEKETLHQLVEEKDQRIYDLQQLVGSLEKEFESSTGSFSSQLLDMQAEMNLLRETWEKMRTAAVLKEMEIQEKNVFITELENDLSNLQEIVGKQDQAVLNSETSKKKIQATLEAKQQEVQKLEYKLERELRKSGNLIKNITEEKGKILEDVMKLSAEKENLLNSLELLSDKIEDLTGEDLKLMANMSRIVQTFDKKDRLRAELDGNDEYDLAKENMNRNISSSPLKKKKVEGIVDERSPFRALNS